MDKVERIIEQARRLPAKAREKLIAALTNEMLAARRCVEILVGEDGGVHPRTS